MLLGIACAALTGCGSSAPSAAKESVKAYAGFVLDPAVTLKPAAASVRFRSTLGGLKTLGNEKPGHVRLLYFGYTHCADVCPTTMADLGIALRRLPTATQDNVEVVFVTSDPGRDTIPAMSAWLSHFDSGLAHPFEGVTAPLKQTDAVAKDVGVPLLPPTRQPNGTIDVGHGDEITAFIGGKGVLLWSASTSPSDYSADIGTLVTTARKS